MATIAATKAGQWSDPTVWAGGVLPGAADTANLATFPVTLDMNASITALTHTSSAGKLLLSGGAYTFTTVTPIQNTLGGGELVSVTGGTHTIGPEVQTGTVSGAVGVRVYGGSATIPAVRGTAPGSSYATVQDGGTLSITSVYGATSSSYQPVVNCIGGVLAIGLVQSNSGATVVTCSGGTIASVTIDEIVATASAPDNTVLISNANAATVMIRRVRSTGSNYAALSTTSSKTYITELIETAGFWPIVGPWKVMDGAALTIKVPTSTAAIATFIPGTPIVQPLEKDVRAGVLYAGRFGTLAVPAPNQVAAGIPVGQAVGTAALLLEDVADVVGNKIAAAESA